MSDDTKALIDRLRDHENEGVTGSDRFHLRNGAADTIERLERELVEMRADRDLHYSRCASLIFSEPFSKVTSAEIQKWHREYVADRDALAERCENLWEALRTITIGYGEFIDDEHTLEVCGLCENEWRRGEPERHASGCLAAPKDAP